MIISAFVAIFVSLTFIWWIKFTTSKYYRLIDQLPGPRVFPVIGNVLNFCNKERRNNPFWALVTLSKDYAVDGFLRFWMLNEGYVVLTKPEAVEDLLCSTKNISKATGYNFLHEWLGSGLLISTGATWHKRRKILTPSFHFRILEDFIHIFNDNSAILLDKLEKISSCGIFDVTPLITLCTLDIICESAMGKAVNAQIKSDSKYVKSVHELGRIIIERTVRPWLFPDILFHLSSYGKQQRLCLKAVHSFTEQVITERRLVFNQRKNFEISVNGTEVRQKQRLAFLDTLFEASLDNETLSNKDIRDEVDTFMFEGHDTTSASISWTLYLLGRYPTEQEKAYNELQTVLGEEIIITASHILQLKYLDAIIKESLRLYPSAALLARKLDEPADIDGHELPGHTNVIVLTYLLHRNPQLFPEPEKFNPSRFFQHNEARTGIKNFSYIPFSAGPRNCIGQKFAQMEEKCVLASIIKKFRIVSHQSPEEMILTALPILHSANGILISLEKR
ncbi:hypothetical protein CHUAL_000823 [Chamberlinius hualienensis]|uniref:Cytochrome P450 4GQ1 n=1 Tax=Chamberlinius hualienensis TaxID=1551368 RepID=A0A1J1DZ54_9MYRI|nr:cytochrome P450 4GQ1 [Chamberlinius hualienensis]